VQETVVKEKIFDPEGDVKRYEFTDFRNRVSHLVNKKREVFRKIWLNIFV
jgi:hypothetical protein